MLAASPIHLRRWDHAARHVEDAQRKTLARILRAAERTEWGRRHGFSRIATYEAFQRQVPVGDYDAFAPFIDRMRGGAKDVLVPGLVPYFGNSSGSSDARRSKWLPITERQILETRRAGADALMRYLVWRGESELVRGFTLGLFHPTDMKKVGPVWETTNPVLMMAKQPLLTRPLTLPRRALDAIPDYDEKLTRIAEAYMDWDVRAVTGTTCWFPPLFERTIEVAQARGRDVRSISDVWPNLRLMLGGGVRAAPYLPLVRRLLGRDDFALVDTYNATEGGIYAASDFSGDPGLLVLPHRGTFFEFAPLEGPRTPERARVPLWAVERDRPYAIVVTTCSGLYAYELGDIVRFPQVDPPRIEFLGRLSGCLSVTQELATHSDVELAVAHAVAACPCTTVDFGASAEIGVGGTTKSRYVLFIEFGRGAEPASLAAFARAFDEGMAKANRVYGEHRGVALLEARVVPLVAGGAQRLMQDVTRGNLQGKFPRILDEDRTHRAFAHAREGERTGDG